MKRLGYIENPEQYARIDNDCMLPDSVIALDFFQDICKEQGVVIEQGVVFLAFFHLASIKDDLLPMWLYVDIKAQKILSTAPVFRTNNFAEIGELFIVNYDVVDNEKVFYWHNKLYTVVYTSTGEMAIRHMRMILYLVDMKCIAELDENIKPYHCYPAKIYNEDDGKFLATVWYFETENSFWFETVCADDDEYLKDINLNNTVPFPINVGEKVIIGDHFFMCRYSHLWDLWFEITPFKATLDDRRKEDIPLPDYIQKQKKNPSKLKVAYRKTPERQSRIVSMHSSVKKQP